MTFGYNLALADAKSTVRLQNWADELLEEVGRVRSSEQEKQRPVLFICHSMGGLVVREAMIRLHRQALKFNGIALEKCGILFLSTPHTGTTKADWNKFVLGISEAFGVRKSDILAHLRSFNPLAVDTVEAFSELRYVPPFACLVEGNKTQAMGILREVSSTTEKQYLFSINTARLFLNHRRDFSV